MERAVLVTVDLGRREAWTAEERSAELYELAASARAKVVHSEIVRRHEPSPACFIGSGKAGEIAGICRDNKANLVIFNNDLTASQQKNLEDIIGVRIIDRTQLILDIFARRAHSNEGKLQVELAQLNYMLPRLMDKGLNMSNPGGGIGTVGPGEQKLEVDRRTIKARVSKLKKDLEGLEKRRGMMRLKRSRHSLVTIAIVGYTNVGKSTLINALTESDVIVRDKLFATLDPTVRKYVMPNKQKVLFIDTVGFIKELPHHLVEAFKATLEEVSEADLVLHIVDSSHPKAIEQSEAVYTVLKQIGAAEKPMVTVLNKSDKAESVAAIGSLRSRLGKTVTVSAINKEGFEELISEISEHLTGTTAVITIRIPASDMKTLNILNENGFIIKREYDGDELIIEAEVPISLKESLTKSSQQ